MVYRLLVKRRLLIDSHVDFDILSAHCLSGQIRSHAKCQPRGTIHHFGSLPIALPVRSKGCGKLQFEMMALLVSSPHF